MLELNQADLQYYKLWLHKIKVTTKKNTKNIMEFFVVTFILYNSKLQLKVLKSIKMI